MDKDLIKNILSRFDNFSFKAFTLQFFKSTKTDLKPIESIGSPDAFYHPLLDSYGGSLHNVYIFHYIPLEVLNKTKAIQINTPNIELLTKKIALAYKGEMGYWGMVSEFLKKAKKLQNIAFLTNFANYSHEEYQEILFPQYASILKKSKIKAAQFIGSFDSFIDSNFVHLQNTFKEFISTNIDGLVVNLTSDTPVIQHFTQEKNLISGVFQENKGLYEPTFVNHNSKVEDILSEFSFLIQNAVSETSIESFLKTHYRIIFGSNYDRIETQLWLRFPEIDINNKNRRMDIFLRNSIENDWELFEIKKPDIKLTKTYRDIPVFRNEITNAMQQLKNYKRLLNDDRVKRELAKSGIEYFEPSLRLVVGRKPAIPTADWRWLKASNQGEIKIITYDDVINEMSMRLFDRNRI